MGEFPMSDDEKFEDVEGEQQEDPVLLEEVEKKIGDLRACVAQNRLNDALALILNDPPYAIKDISIKNKLATAALAAVALIKESDIDSVLDQLSSEQHDVLMKYLYKFMDMNPKWEGAEERAKQSAKILKFHAKLTEKAGLGCIARVLTDRKVV
eukprot:c1791_g1_i1.p1 GENE.c1791_g1_i1~~c1791_g1_i1.p1  ORF type:complete len:154 (+),score=39.59 c1791_g1_i1:1-462(+)